MNRVYSMYNSNNIHYASYYINSVGVVCIIIYIIIIYIPSSDSVELSYFSNSVSRALNIEATLSSISLSRREISTEIISMIVTTLIVCIVY